MYIVVFVVIIRLNFSGGYFYKMDINTEATM